MAPWLELPYDMTSVTEDEDKLIKKCLLGYTRPFIKCGKKGYVMPGAFRKHAEAIYNMEVRPDDLWVITFPRSGTTWSQELVWLLQNNLDYQAAKETPLYERFPMLETTSQIPEVAFELIKINFMNLGDFQGLRAAAKCPSWKMIEDAPSPRFIKTHLPLSMLPPQLLSTARVIYVARDPRDVAVSYFYMHKMVIKNLMRTNFQTFWEAFRKDLLPYTPIVAHTEEAWRRRDHPNMYFVFYENLHKDLRKEVRNIANFLGKTYTEDEIETLSEYLSFDSLRKNKSVNNTITNTGSENIQFIRKGEAGGWKGHFDEKMTVQAEEYLIERLTKSEVSYPSFPFDEITHL